MIGWAYLVASMLYIASARQIAPLLGGMALLYALFLADRAGMFAGAPLRGRIDFGTQLGSHAAITVAGVVLGQMLVDTAPARSPWQIFRWIVVFGAMAFVGAMLLEPLHGVNKNNATPAWCLFSVAWCCWIYAAMYAVMDIARATRWAWPLCLAGEHPLLAYLLSHIVYYVFCMWPDNPFWNHATRGYGALAVYAALALAITLFSGWAGRRWLRLKL